MVCFRMLQVILIFDNCYFPQRGYPGLYVQLFWDGYLNDFISHCGCVIIIYVGSKGPEN